MVCKKCGEELNDKYAFCPKCGNKIKRGPGAGKIVGIALPVVLIAACVILYASGYYKSILAQFGIESEKNVSDETMVSSEEILTVDKDTDTVDEESSETESEETDIDNINEEAAKEEVVISKEEAELISQYVKELSLEPVEMTIGESYQVELEWVIPNASWNSSDEKIVKVVDGKLNAVMPGTASITLSTEERDLSFDVAVNSFPDITLAVNYSTTLEINDALSDVRWESSAPEIVSIEDGVITSLSSGASDITAHIGDASYTFEVVATTPDITTTSVRKIIGNTEQVSILGTHGTAEWKSDNTAIATVSDTGLITAEPTGAGQSTVVHAYVDGMEFKIDVAVEPIPQLSSTYKIYGHQDNRRYKNAKATICINANEVIMLKCSSYSVTKELKAVLNVADEDYSDGMTFPLYRSFWSEGDKGTYTDVYLVGTSQTAEVIIQNISTSSYEDSDSGVRRLRYEHADSVVTYEPCDNYDIIHIYHDPSHEVSQLDVQLVTVSVDGYQYQFAIDENEHEWTFSYDGIDRLPANYMIEECSVDEVIEQEKINVNYASLKSNSKTYYTSNDWVDRIGTKFVEAVEDEAISLAVGALFKLIF